MQPIQSTSRTQRGFSLVELMVAVALGLLLVTAMAYVYASSKTGFARYQQLSALQQSVRIAFEYLSTDARMAGHVGCYTGNQTTSSPATFNNSLSSTSTATNFALGIEGYDYSNSTANAYALTSNSPADVATASSWRTNSAVTGGINTIPVSSYSNTGLTPGSDVLIVRTAVGRPLRLTADANVGASQSTLAIETLTGTGTCSDGATAKVSGLCASSYGLIASCTQARAFQVNAIAAGAAGSTQLTLAASMGGDPVYPVNETEVFAMQTIAYYVKRSASGTTTSLYRRVFDGDNAGGLEQELIEGVESLQVTYGIDTVPATGAVSSYVTAESVTAWDQVLAVRVGLLIRSTLAAESDLAAALPASASVNGVGITFPTSGPKYDRRVFTTTIALRNKV